MKFKTIALGAIMALLATPTLAEQKTSWTGFYVGAHGGMDLGQTDLSAGPASLSGVASNGFGYGINAGFDLHIPGAPIVVGIGGDYTWSDSEFKASLGTARLTAGLEKGWAVFGRVGVPMGNVMPYVLAGYTEADAGASWNVFGGGSADTTLKGYMGGGGIEIMLTQNIAMGAEYRYTKFDDVTVVIPGPDLNIDPDRHEVRATLKFKTGGLF